MGGARYNFAEFVSFVHSFSNHLTMRVPVYRSKTRYGFNMTPMIDVVFLLIIFFLVSSHLAKQESTMDLLLPIAKTGQDDENQTAPRVTINVQTDGSLWLAGRPIAANQLSEKFTALRTEKGNDIEVRIRGSRAATYSTVEPIMLACAQSSIWNVTYAVYRETP
jgi:biopolymer transport protein ExbD